MEVNNDLSPGEEKFTQWAGMHLVFWQRMLQLREASTQQTGPRSKPCNIYIIHTVLSTFELCFHLRSNISHMKS